MIQPRSPLLWLAFALTLFGIASAIWPALQPGWEAALALVSGMALLDGLLAWRQRPALFAERRVSGIVSVGTATDVSIELRNTGAGTLRLRLYDHHPASWRSEGLPLILTLATRQGLHAHYRATPLSRGEFEFGRIEARLQSPLRLWDSKRWFGEPKVVRVYPNFAKVAGYNLLATANRLGQLGVLQRRRRGEGMEFHQLREYREGDSQRQIDWKATARSRKLISREYQDERDQQVVFLIDAGRRMSAQDGELSHFDHSLNALLLLSHVALRQGDAVGMMTFATQSPRYVPPRKSLSTSTLLMETLFDLQPGHQAPDFVRAALDVMTRIKRRSLVIVVTSLRDEDDATLGAALRLLRERHLVVLASLREGALVLDDQPAATLDDALTTAATIDYLARREQALLKLAASGVRCLDVPPAQLPVSLVNRYLELKHSHAW